MKTLGAIPEAVCVTIQTFKELIHLDEQRRRELLAEIAALRVRERVIGATEDSSWVTTRFIEPRLAELRTVEARINIVRDKLAKLLDQWSKPSLPTAPAPAAVPAAPKAVWVETGHPSMLSLAV